MDPNAVPRLALAPAAPHLRLLGRFELCLGGRPLRVSPAGERLLAYLGIRAEPISRPALGAALWPDCTDARATANLRSALYRLPGERRDELVSSSPHTVALDPAVSVDVYNLSGKLSRVPAAGDQDVSVSMLRQDVLPEWPEEWLIGTREWFRQIRLRALDTLSDRHRATGCLGAAMEAGMAAVACDPLRESAHRRLAQVHMAEGNFAEALRQYDVYRRLLRAELGLPPSREFRRLIAPLLGRPLDAPAS
jgi:DNA-binding SARP family transcriptional activator